jgi:hypothetical protein
MNIEEIREYCVANPWVTEGFPFNDTALVFPGWETTRNPWNLRPMEL